MFSSKSLGNCMQHFFVKAKIKEHLYNPRKFPYATFIHFYLYLTQSLSDLYNHILALPFLEIHANRITLYTFLKNLYYFWPGLGSGSWTGAQWCRDKVLNLWSGSTDLKTLDCWRTNPREYQKVRTHTKKVY